MQHNRPTVLFLLIVASMALAGTAWAQAGSVLSYQKISNTQGGFGALLDNLDEFGGAVTSLGDLDGAGTSVAAFAAGAIGDDDGGSNRGAVYVVFVNSSLAVQSFQKISDTQGNFAGVFDNGDEFGSSVAGLGDLDGGGASAGALAVGVAFDDDGSTNRGAVYVLFLNSAGSVLSFQKISSTQGGFTGALDSADEFGGACAHLGDLDGAGPSVAALAVGAAGDDDGGGDRGAVWILFLNSAGSVISHQKISATSGGFGAPNLEQFGSSIAYLGDLDGNGPSVAAIAVGAVADSDGGSERGAVYILFLNSNGTVLSYQKISSTQGGFTGQLDDFDEFGGAVAGLGDIDGCGAGVYALAVGAIGDDDGGTDRGAIWVLFLNSNGTVLGHQKISDTAGSFTATIDDGDDFGTALAALGDLNGSSSGVQTLLAGAAGDDDGGGGRGAVYELVLNGQTCTGAGLPPGALRASLGLAVPNPFNPRTTIPFSVAEGGQVRIVLWDVQGRQVRQLVDSRYQPGEHRIVWDGLDDAGRSMPSGTYFYGMSVDGRAVAVAEKAVLLK